MRVSLTAEKSICFSRAVSRDRDGARAIRLDCREHVPGFCVPVADSSPDPEGDVRQWRKSCLAKLRPVLRVAFGQASGEPLGRRHAIAISP